MIVQQVIRARMRRVDIGSGVNSFFELLSFFAHTRGTACCDIMIVSSLPRCYYIIILQHTPEIDKNRISWLTSLLRIMIKAKK